MSQDQRYFKVVPKYHVNLREYIKRSFSDTFTMKMNIRHDEFFVRAKDENHAVIKVENYINSHEELRTSYIDNSCEVYNISNNDYYGRRNNAYPAIFL